LEREFGAASAVADATGGFAFDNPAAGRYLLVFERHAANGLAARDRTGKVRFRTLEVPPGGTVDASFNFGPTAYRQP
jgi:hypothetical protein